MRRTVGSDSSKLAQLSGLGLIILLGLVGLSLTGLAVLDILVIDGQRLRDLVSQSAIILNSIRCQHKCFKS